MALHLVGSPTFWSFTLGRQEVGHLLGHPSWVGCGCDIPQGPKVLCTWGWGWGQAAGGTVLSLPPFYFCRLSASAWLSTASDVTSLMSPCCRMQKMVGAPTRLVCIGLSTALKLCDHSSLRLSHLPPQLTINDRHLVRWTAKSTSQDSLSDLCALGSIKSLQGNQREPQGRYCLV